MQVQTFGDKAAIGISLICALHCIATPLLLLSIPAIGSWFIADEHFHQLLIYLVLPISVMALALGCRKHSNYRIFILGGCGLATLIAAAFFMHDLVGESGEQILTLIGTCLVTLAHWQNYQLCRSED